MKIPFGATAVLVAVLSISACSSNSRAALTTDLRSAATDVVDAAGDAANNAAEVLARNIATQQGEQQFKSSGHELSGPLTCTAKVNKGVSKIDIACTGTTKTGGVAALGGTTDQLPGASVTSLTGQFVGTADGAPAFTTQRLGG
jgi:hypothetical protein